MGIAFGDLLQITDKQEYLGEQMLNVYYYRYFSAPILDNSGYEPLVDQFVSFIIGSNVYVQVPRVEHLTVEIRNLSNGVDFFEKPVNQFGIFVGDEDEDLPSYVSLGWQLNRDSLVTRNGFKRLGGISDLVVDGNDYVGSMTPIGAISDNFAYQLKIGLIDVAAPVIPKRPLNVPMGTDYVYSSVTSATFKGVGTQNTRKKGRGS